MIVLHARPSPGFREAVDAIFGPGVVVHVDEAAPLLRAKTWLRGGRCGCLNRAPGRAFQERRQVLHVTRISGML